MSDDEYYDEFDEDIFWIEEPEPDAAVSPIHHHPIQQARTSRTDLS